MYLSRPCSKKKSDTFNSLWEITYLCRYNEGQSQCLICEKKIFCKRFNVKRHYDTHHISEFSQYEGAYRRSLYEELISSVGQNKVVDQDKIVDQTHHSDSDSKVDSLHASYEIALELVRGNHPFSDADFVKTCRLKAVAIMSKEKLPKYDTISFSRATVSRRLQDMAKNSEQQLKERINSFVAVSLALDESTDTTQLIVFIRGVDAELNITEELLDIIPMKEATTAGDILKYVDDCVERMGLPWEKVVCVATDGATVMMEHTRGFIALLRQKLRTENLKNDFVALHCLIHQEILCSKSISLYNVMNFVVQCVNWVRAHGLSHPEFKDFFDTLETDHTEIPYFNEIRWLSRGETLKRFFELRNQIYEFLKESNKPCLQFLDPEWIADLAFMTDIIQHINALNIALLGKHKLVHNMSDEIEAFNRKLSLWKRQLDEANFTFFPCLQSLAENQLVNVAKYCTEISNLENQFAERFSELVPLKDDLEMFVSPFAIEAYSAPSELQMELIELQCDTRMKNNYKELTCLTNFYKQLCINKYANIRAFAINIIAMFGSTYSCDKFFSTLILNKIRLRSRLTDVNMGAVLRLASAQGIKPNIYEIISNKRCPLSPQTTKKIKTESE